MLARELVNARREAFREANSPEAATNTDFKRLVDAAVGPTVLQANGRLAQKEATALSDGRLLDQAEACHVTDLLLETLREALRLAA